MDTNQWQTHSQVIDAQDAQRMGLNVEILDRRSKLWDAIWTLHTPSADGVGANSKFFESEYVCLPM